jgi:glycine hydroxymethyltransferase
MREPEMARLAAWIHAALARPDDAAALARIAAEVEELCLRFPVPGLPEAG